MFKSVFSKYFAVLSLLFVLGFLAMSGLQVALFTRSLAEDKRTLLTENAISIAQHTADVSVDYVVGDDGQMNYILNKQELMPFLRLVGDAIDATFFMTDTKGKVLICSDPSLNEVEGTSLESLMAESGGQSLFETTTLDGLYQQPQYTVGVPIMSKDRVIGYVLASAPATTIGVILANNIKVYLISALGALVLSFVVGYILTLRLVRPLRQMAAATRRFAQGDFSVRVAVRGKDEVAELADALNHMAVSLSSLETMRRSFVANVSHELKTPMTTIAGFVDGMLDGTVPPQEQKRYMRIVSDEVKRLSRLVRSMLDLSRIDSGELKMTTVRMNLTEALCAVLVSSEQRIEKKNLCITGLEDCAKVEIDGDVDLMSQVLYNLVDNAIKFTDDGGRIDIRLTTDSGYANFVIRNTGAGIPAQEMPQIFERFYKSDRSRGLDKNGMGLGLYIVRTVVNLHGGEVAVRSVEGEFTEFSFRVPSAASGH